MNKKCIAMIYEGEKTERILVEKVKKIFFHDSNLIPITFPAGENLYMLWSQLKEDDFQTDLLEVLREYNDVAKEALKDYGRNDFSEIYLFFDYDRHSNNIPKGLNPEVVLQQMIETFSDETDLGKLYINYPMVEALRDNLPQKQEMCYRRCRINLDEMKGYKNLVSDVLHFQDFRKLTLSDWQCLCKNGIRRLNCMINSKYEIPERASFISRLTQLNLYKKQSESFVKTGNIFVISSFPLFLLEYFKEEFWENMCG